jgi:hypothetical protein
LTNMSKPTKQSNLFGIGLYTIKIKGDFVNDRGKRAYQILWFQKSGG